MTARWTMFYWLMKQAGCMTFEEERKRRMEEEPQFKEAWLVKEQREKEWGKGKRSGKGRGSEKPVSAGAANKDGGVGVLGMATQGQGSSDKVAQMTTAVIDMTNGIGGAMATDPCAYSTVVARVPQSRGSSGMPSEHPELAGGGGFGPVMRGGRLYRCGGGLVLGRKFFSTPPPASPDPHRRRGH